MHPPDFSLPGAADHAATAVARLVAQLRPEALPDQDGARVFHAASASVGTVRLFGGQMLGQALAVAGACVQPGLSAQSLHAFFLRPGAQDRPLQYRVRPIRESRDVAVLEVSALQDGEALLHATASFHRPRPGPAHQETPLDMATIPPPEDLPDELELHREANAALRNQDRVLALSSRPVELRPVSPVDPLRPARVAADSCTWLRVRAPLPEDLVLHRAVLAYASDFALLRSALRPHGITLFQPGTILASLNHALWQHEDARLDDWLLYRTESPRAAGGLALCRGSLFTREGRLVASVAQEGLIRQSRPPAVPAGAATDPFIETP